MRRLGIIIILIALTFVAADGAGAGEILGTTDDEIAAAISAALPGESRVAFVRGDEIYIDEGVESGVYPGLVMAIERIGAEIRHPVTQEVIGRERRPLANLTIEWAGDGLSRGRLIVEGDTGTSDVRAMDIARPLEPPVLALLGLRHADGRRTALTEAVDSEISSAMGGLTGLRFVAGSAMAIGPEDIGLAGDAAEGATLALGGRINGDRIRIVLFHLATGTLLGEWTTEVPPEAAALADEIRAEQYAGRGGIEGGLEAVAYHESGGFDIPLDFVPLDIAIGDIDGDGRDEVITVERRRVRAFSISPNGGIEEVLSDGIGWTASAIFVEAADMDGDGTDEIYIVEKPGSYVRSSGWRVDDGRLRRFWRESDIFVRSVRGSEGDILYGQHYGQSRLFERGIFRLRWNGEDFEEVATGLAGTITLYDFDHLGTTGFVASIDYENRIRLYGGGGDIVWRSAETYGGSNTRLESADSRGEDELRAGIASEDIDADGAEDLILVQNLLRGGGPDAFVRIREAQRYVQGRIVAMRLESGRLQERWHSRNYEGEIIGLSIGRPTGRGLEAVFMTVERVSLRRKVATIHILPLT